MKRRAYTKEDYEEAKRLRRELGYSYAKISRLIKAGQTTVRDWCLGIKKPYSAFTEKEMTSVNQRKADAKKGKLNPNYGKPLAHKTKKKLSMSLKGKTHTDEAKQNMSLSKTGSKNPRWMGDTASQDAGRKRARHRYKTPEGKQIHHIDGNTLNNDPENIQFVTPKEHIHIDGRINNLIQFNKKR